MRLRYLSSVLAAAQGCFGCLHHLKRSAPPPEVRPRCTATAPVKTAIENVHVFDGNGFTAPQTIILSDGKITNCAGQIDTVVDGAGRFLIPGLTDAHIHVTDTDSLEKLASWGVTTALNMDCEDYNLCAQLRNQTGMASFLSTGRPATGVNATPNPVKGAAEEPLVYPDTNMSQLVSWAFGNGSDWFKTVAQTNGPTTQQHMDAVAAAHGMFDRLAVTHASDVKSYKQAIDSFTDIIQHIPDDGLISAPMIAAMRAHWQAVTPTMAIFKLGHTDPRIAAFLGRDLNGTSYDNVENNVRALHARGVPVLAGTDAVGDLVPGIEFPHGPTLHEELELLHKAGLSPLEALRAATVNVARWHRLSDRGTIEVGKRADVVLLNSNPLVNISNTRDIAQVWVGGISIQHLKQ